MYIPENVSETSSESALSTAFDSYCEYTDYVKQFLSANTTTEWDEELWLGQLPIDGHTIQWYRLSSHSKNTSAGFETHGTDTDMYKSTGSKETFQEQLRTPKTSVSWQILLVQFNCEFRREFLLYDDWYRDSMLWCFDIIGLALDLPLCVWNHLKDRLQGMGTPRLDTFRVSWNDDCSALDLGLNTMVTLNTKGGILPPTVVAFLPLNNPVRIGDPMNQRCGNPVRLNHPKWAQSIVSTPSKAMTNEKATFWRPANNEPAESQYLRKMIARTGARSNSPSVTDGAFACFAALLEFHLGHPSQNIPKLDYSQDSRDKVCLRHYSWPEDPWGDTRVTDVLVPTRSLLMRLRDEVDMNIMMSEKIKEYTKDHFKTLNDYQQKTLQALVGRLRLHLVHLQLTEANLKDRLSAYASEQTTEMAERNIQESKRVILLTTLAFVFLPVSLASSIFGMNVREINNTGHSICAFATTAFVLCMGTMTIWGVVAKLVSLRERLAKEWSGKVERPNSKMDDLVLNGFSDLWFKVVYTASVICVMYADLVRHLRRAEVPSPTEEHA